jgi:heterodisulfide reductase subunit A
VAITAVEGKAAAVNVANCHGCGTCVASCPHDAIEQMHFTDPMIFSQIRAALENKPEEKILVFACNWCCYGGSDLAGTSRFTYPPNSRIIRVMCSGRVDTDFVAEAYRLGAGAVMVGACHRPTDCHYITGNHIAYERFQRYRKVLEGAGISPERFLWKEISAAEGLIFAKTMKELNQKLNDIGIDRIKEENEKARKRISAPLKRKGLIPLIEIAEEDE